MWSCKDITKSGGITAAFEIFLAASAYYTWLISSCGYQTLYFTLKKDQLFTSWYVLNYKIIRD